MDRSNGCCRRTTLGTQWNFTPRWFGYLNRAIQDEDRQPERDALFANIYGALSDGLRDYFGMIDAAINTQLALIDGMAVRGAVLDVLLQEYETRFRAAVGVPRGFGKLRINPTRFAPSR